MACKEISRPVANAVVMPLRKPTRRTSAQQALRKAGQDPDPDGACRPAPADARLGAPAARQELTARHRMVQRGRPGPRFPRAVSGGSDQPTPGRGPVGPEHPGYWAAGRNFARLARTYAHRVGATTSAPAAQVFPTAAEGSALGVGPEAACRGTVRRGEGLSTCRATAQRRPRIGRVGRPSRPLQQRQI